MDPLGDDIATDLHTDKRKPSRTTRSCACGTQRRRARRRMRWCSATRSTRSSVRSTTRAAWSTSRRSRWATAAAT
eukprot:5816737-Prymnesium_polylepis.1